MQQAVLNCFFVEAEDCNHRNRLEYINLAPQGQLLCRISGLWSESKGANLAILVENICKRFMF